MRDTVCEWLPSRSPWAALPCCSAALVLRTCSCARCQEGVICRSSVPPFKYMPNKPRTGCKHPMAFEARPSTTGENIWEREIIQKVCRGHHQQQRTKDTPPCFFLSSLDSFLRQVALSNMFALVGTLVVHYRHSDSFPSNSVPVWVCAVGFVAVLTGLVLHQVGFVGLVSGLTRPFPCCTNFTPSC